MFSSHPVFEINPSFIISALTAFTLFASAADFPSRILHTHNYMAGYDTTIFSEQQSAILAVAENFLHALGTRDKATMLDQVLLSGGVTMLRNGAATSITLGDIVEETRTFHPSKRIAEVVSGQPTVLVDRDIAMVWTPFEFFVDGVLDHNGTNIWSLAKLEDGKWKITGVADNFHRG